MALTTDPTIERRAVQVVVSSLVVVLAVLEAMDRLDMIRRRADRRLTSWWADVERRQRMELRQAEGAALLRVLGRNNP